jgi:tape measure domain-containing protein
MATERDLIATIALGLKMDDAQARRAVQQLALTLGRDTAGFTKAGQSMGSSFTDGVKKATDALPKQMAEISEQSMRALANTITEGQRRMSNEMRIEAQKQADITRKQEQTVVNVKKQGGIDQAAVFRANARSQLQAQQQADRMAFTQEQNSQARKTAVVKAGLSVITNTYEAGLSAIGTVWRWAFRDREKEQQQSDSRMTANIQQTMVLQQTAISIGLTQQNAIYTRGAQERLRQIEKDAQKEKTIITEAQVKQAAAVKEIQDRTQTGVIGKATGGAGLLGKTADIKTLLAGGGSALGIGALFKAGWERQTQIQDSTTAIATILGSQKKAAELTANILKTVKGTPFSFPEFAQAGKNLVAFGISADKIPSILTAIGDSAAASGKGAAGLNQVADAFGKIAAKGRVQLGDVWSIAEAGVPALDILANGFEVSTSQMQKMIEDGLVPADEALGYLTKGIEEGSTAVGEGAKDTKAYGGTMKALAKTVSGSTANAKAAFARLGAALVAPVFKATPGVFKKITAGLDVLTRFTDKVVTGKGAWKILRDGLVGIGVGLAAIVTAKAGFEIIKLMPPVFAALTAHPIILGFTLLAGAIGALVMNNEAIGNFFKSLWEGTRGWFLVGYRIKGVYDKLSPMVTIQTSLGAAARKAVDFFKAFRDGTRGWFLVGYRLGEVYDKLTPIVTLQSAIGAAARAFRDAFGMFTAIIKEKGLSTDSIFEGLSVAGDVISKRMAPIKEAVLTALGEIRTMVADFFKGLFTDPLKDVEVSPFDLSAVFGDAKNDASAAKRLGERLRSVLDTAFDKVQRAVSSLFAGLIEGAVQVAPFDFVGQLFQADPSKENAAARTLGDGIHRIVATAIKSVGRAIGSLFTGLFGEADATAENEAALKLGQAIHRIVTVAISTAGRAMGSFFSGLFKENPAGEHVAAMALGIQLRRIVQTAFKTVVTTGGDFFSSLFTGGQGVATGAERVGRTIHDTLARWFSDIGELLSSGLLSAIIDFPRVVGKFISKTIFSEPLMKAAIAAAAAIGGVAAVIAVQFIRGFAEGLWEQRGAIFDTIRDIVVLAVKTLLGTGNPFLLIGGALVAAFAAIKVGGPIFAAFKALRANVSTAFLLIKGDTGAAATVMRDYRSDISKTALTGQGLGSSLVKGADGLRSSFGVIGNIVSGLWSTLTSIGRWPAQFAEKFDPQIQKIKDAISTLFEDPEFSMPDFGGDDGMGLMDKIKGNFELGFDLVTTKAKSFADGIKTYLRKAADEFSFVAGVANLTMGAISGYFISTADNAAVKSASIVASIGNIAGAFAENPYLGLAAAAGTAIGFIAGELTKGKEDAKKYADFVKKQGESIRTSLTESMVNSAEAGQRGAKPQQAAILSAINDQMKESETIAANVKTQFGITYGDIAKGFSGTRVEAQKFSRSVIDQRIKQVLDGNRDAMGHFRGQIRMATEDVKDQYYNVLDWNSGLKGAFSNLRNGNIDIDEFRSRAKKAGVSAGDLRDITKDWTDSLQRHIENSPAAKFLKQMPGNMTAARKEAIKQIETQGYLDQAQERSKTPIQRLNEKIGAQSSAWDTARSAVRNYIDAKNGLAPSGLETEKSLRGVAVQLSELKDTYDGNIDKSILLGDAQGFASDKMADLASSGITNAGKLKAAYVDWIDNVFIKNLPKSVRDNKTLVGELRTNLINLPDGTAEVAIANVREEKGKVGDVKTALDAVVNGSPYVALLTVEQQEALAGTKEAKMSAVDFSTGYYSGKLDSDPETAKAKIAATKKEAVGFATGDYTAGLDAKNDAFMLRVNLSRQEGATWEEAIFAASVSGDKAGMDTAVKLAHDKGLGYAKKLYQSALSASVDQLEGMISIAEAKGEEWKRKVYQASWSAKLKFEFDENMTPEQRAQALRFVEGTSSKPPPVASLKNIGKKARGGFIRKPEVTLVGESGAELILPLTDPRRTQALLAQAGLAGPVVGAATPAAAGLGAGPRSDRVAGTALDTAPVKQWAGVVESTVGSMTQGITRDFYTIKEVSKVPDSTFQVTAAGATTAIAQTVTANAAATTLHGKQSTFGVTAAGAPRAKAQTDAARAAGQTLNGKVYSYTVKRIEVTEKRAGKGGGGGGDYAHQWHEDGTYGTKAAGTAKGTAKPKARGESDEWNDPRSVYRQMVLLNERAGRSRLTRDKGGRITDVQMTGSALSVQELAGFGIRFVQGKGWTVPRNWRWLAGGGFITKPEIAVVGESGAELVLPLTDPKRVQELLRQAGLADKVTATSASAGTAAPVKAAGALSAAGGAGPVEGAALTASATLTAQADVPGITKATEETAAAFGPLGVKMTEAAKPGLATLDQTAKNNATAIKTSYSTSQQATVKSSAAWPNQMRAAALPGIQTNQAIIARTNQNVRSTFTQTQAHTTASSRTMATNVAANTRVMSAGVTTAASTMQRNVTTQANTMASNLSSSARRGATGAVSVMKSTLSTGVTEVNRIVYGYTKALVGALNPVLKSVSAKPITLPPPATGKAMGGYIDGPNVNRDVVPAMLMPGEVVIRKASVQKYGVRQLLDINEGRMPRFAAGGLVFPIAGYSTKGQANSWGNPRSGGRSHKGSDLFAPLGTPVVAAKEGVVTKTNPRESGLGGITVTVENGGWNYYYAHLTRIANGIAAGVAVKAGQVLGSVGQTGNARGTSPHLHFSVYPVAGGYNAGVNPWDLLTGSSSVGALANMGGAAGPAFTMPPIPKTKDGWIGDTAKAVMEFTAKAIDPWIQSHVNTFGAASSTNFPIDPAIFKGKIDPNAVLKTIRLRESGGNYQSQWANGPGRVYSTASGAYGMLDSTWRHYSGMGGRAKDASPADQDRAAMNMLMETMGKYGPILQAIPITWYTGHYTPGKNYNYDPGDGGNVAAYVNKWIQQYQSVLSGSSVRLEEGGLVPMAQGALSNLSPNSIANNTTSTNNRSFEGPIIGNVNVHSNATDAEAIAMLLGARLDPIARRALVGA